MRRAARRRVDRETVLTRERVHSLADQLLRLVGHNDVGRAVAQEPVVAQRDRRVLGGALGNRHRFDGTGDAVDNDERVADRAVELHDVDVHDAETAFGAVVGAE